MTNVSVIDEAALLGFMLSLSKEMDKLQVIVLKIVVFCVKI